MPVSYSVDVMRHWSCKCDEGEALAFRSHLAASGLELPESDVPWVVVVNEPEVASSDVAAWQHVVSACVKAGKDGLKGKALAELNKVLNDLSLVVATLNAREAVGWADFYEVVAGEPVVVVDSVPEVAAEVPAPNQHEFAIRPTLTDEQRQELIEAIQQQHASGNYGPEKIVVTGETVDIISEPTVPAAVAADTSDKLQISVTPPESAIVEEAKPEVPAESTESNSEVSE